MRVKKGFRMKMKKILFVANVAKEHINKFHIPTIWEFQKQGWIVDVACSGDEDVPLCNHQFRMCWKRSPFTVKTLKGICDLKKIIDKGEYDIIYCHTPVGGLVGRIASHFSKKSRAKVVYCAHGLHFFKGAPKLNWIIYYPIEKILAHFTDVFFTVNKEDYILVTKKFNKKMKTLFVPEVGVDFTRFNVENRESTREEYRNEFGIPQNTIVLIYVAELIKNKNQGMLIDALEKLHQKGEKAYLFLVGPDHADGYYEKYAAEKGLEQYIRFPGWRSDVGQFMIASDICVASSIREGFGINLVEAMYCGLPVVATNNRGHVTIVEDGQNGFLVNPGDSDKMADYVYELINNSELYAKMSNVDVSKYDTNRIAEELYSILNEL